MKKIVTLDSIMVSFISALGYGAGYVIPSASGAHPILALIICFAVGGAAAAAAEKIIFSSSVQSSTAKKHGIFAATALLFAVGYYCLARYYSHSLLEDLSAEITFSVVIPILGFFVSLGINAIRRKKLLAKYGTGESGFLFDDGTEDVCRDRAGDNAELSGYSGKDPAVRTITGTFIGKADRNGVRFLGIPYAKAPVGENRWKRPIPAEASDKTFEAYYFGRSEIQPDSSHNILNRFKQSEACLNLNIWTAKLEPEAKKPVVVYLHGGDGRYGGSANPIYQLDTIAHNIPDAVFVSINYRIGVFGVVDFPPEADANGECGESTALTLLDQIEALKWIRANIAAFGGDPENITAVGDTSGGSCILLLAAMKEAKGFFRRAFIMCSSTYDVPVNNETASAVGLKLLEEFGEETVSGLKNISSEQLRDFENAHYEMLELPPRDGRIIPQDLEKEYLAGTAEDIEFIFGIAEDDFSGWQATLTGDYSLDRMVEEYYRNLRESVGEKKAEMMEDLLQKRVEAGMSVADARRTLLTDFHYKAGPLHDCRTLARGGSKVRCFYWDVKGDIEKLRASSISVVTTVLGNSDIAEQMGYLNDRNITEILQAFFGKYIHGKDMRFFNNELKGVGEIIWDEFTADRESTLHVQKGSIAMTENAFSEDIREVEKTLLC